MRKIHEHVLEFLKGEIRKDEKLLSMEFGVAWRAIRNIACITKFKNSRAHSSIQEMIDTIIPGNSYLSFFTCVYGL